MIGNQSEVFEQVMGLLWPWRIDSVTFDDANRLLLVHLASHPEGTFTCGTCGAGGCPARDTVHKKWRHRDFFHYRTFVHVEAPRVRCPSCGIRHAELPWVRKRQRLTVRFEEHVVKLAGHMPLRAVARVVGEHESTIRRIVAYYRKHLGK